MTVHVIGNVTEDVVLRLDRLPEPGETLIATRQQTDIGGKGFNQALILARCGIDTLLTAPVGGDKAGRSAAALASAVGLRTAFIESPHPTDQSIIYVDASGENTIVSTTDSAATITSSTVIDNLDAMSPGTTVLLQGNLSRDATLAALTAARQRGFATVVNAAPIQWSFDDLWPFTDLAIVNVPELRALTGHAEPDDGADFLRAAGVGDVLLTRGGEGAVLYGNQSTIAIPAALAEVRDTAGAGDTFTAVFLAARVLGHDDKEALCAAALASAITVSRHGTSSAFPTGEELRAILGRQNA